MIPHYLNPQRNLIIPGDYQTTILFSVQHLISIAQKAIQTHGAFHIAISGGSTPKAILEQLTSLPYAERIDWTKVHLFWSDERAVPPEHSESNYQMAMQAGLQKMPIPKDQIHRMVGETEIETNALHYEKTIHTVLNNRPFDLVMLGMGEDGHTASLFPNTEGLQAKGRLVVANFVPQKKCWRMTLTFEAINAASHIVIYVLGAAKKHALQQVLSSPTNSYPILQVGTPSSPALWICDEAAFGGYTHNSSK